MSVVAPVRALVERLEEEGTAHQLRHTLGTQAISCGVRPNSIEPCFVPGTPRRRENAVGSP